MHPVYILYIYILGGGFKYTKTLEVDRTGRIYFWGRLHKKYLTTSQADGSPSGFFQSLRRVWGWKRRKDN